MYFKTTNSPLGPITVFAEADNIIALEFGSVPENKSSPLLEDAVLQLASYFKGDHKHFSIPIGATGTNFQKTVWSFLIKIPYGSTLSYGDIARDLGSSPRAIGGACGKNPISIIIPCHRVLAANLKIGGYSSEGGILTKAALLRIEGITLNLRQHVKEKL